MKDHGTGISNKCREVVLSEGAELGAGLRENSGIDRIKVKLALGKLEPGADVLLRPIHRICKRSENLNGYMLKFRVIGKK